jgi:hypothetical protein
LHLQVLFCVGRDQRVRQRTDLLRQRKRLRIRSPL